MGELITKEVFESAIEELLKTMNDIAAFVKDSKTAVDAEINHLKTRNSTLDVAVNWRQSSRPEKGGGSGTKQEEDVRDEKPGAGGVHIVRSMLHVHRLNFLDYDGKDDPITWLHRCEQFSRVQQTAEEG